MDRVEIDLRDLPKIKNRDHRQFLLNYAMGMDPVESYHSVYGDKMKLASAKTSASTLLNRDDYIKFLDEYSNIKIKKQMEKEVEAISGAMHPLGFILNLRELAESSKNRNPGVARDINLELLKMSGTEDLIAKIVRDSLIAQGYDIDETALGREINNFNNTIGYDPENL